MEVIFGWIQDLPGKSDLQVPMNVKHCSQRSFYTLRNKMLDLLNKVMATGCTQLS